MWKFLNLLIFVSFVFGESPWKLNHEYTYNIHSRTLTAIPDLKNQFVGVITKGKLILQVESENLIVGKLVNVVHGHFHDIMEERWNLESYENDVTYEPTNMNNKSFLMHVDQGMIKTISVDHEMTNDQVNQLRAIISQFQIVTDEKYLIQRPYNQLPETERNPHGMYTVMEPSVTGYCETVYDVEPVPDYLIQNSYAHWVSTKPLMNSPKTENDDQYFQIVKTMNYSNCEVERIYNFGINGDSAIEPNSNQLGDFLSKSIVTKILAKGNWKNFRIQNAYTTNRIVVNPEIYKNQHSEVRSEIQLMLTNEKSITEKLEKPTQSINVEDLVYRYNRPSDKDNRIVTSNRMNSNVFQNYDEVETSRFSGSVNNDHNGNQIKSTWRGKSLRPSSYFRSNVNVDPQLYYQPRPNMEEAPEIPLNHFTIGNQGRSIQKDKKINLEKEVVKLVIEISEDLLNQNEIPRRDTLQKFDILSDVLRTMNLQQIQNIANQMPQSDEKNEDISQTLSRKIFNNAVAVAGTGPAVNAVLRWISERRIKGVEAQNILEDILRNVQVPTIEVMRKLFEFSKTEQVKQDKELYSISIISFTDLLRRAHTDRHSARNYYPVQVFGPFSEEIEEFITKEYIPYLSSSLERALNQQNRPDVLLYIRAMGNLGHPDIVQVYESYMENDSKLSSFQRTSMVLSLDKLTKIHTRLARNVLYKIVTNVAEMPETRSVAVLLLMRSDPTVEMLQRMAEMTHNDPSEAVQSIIKTAIESVSELKNNRKVYIARRAKSVKHLLNQKQFDDELSRTYIRDYVSREMDLVYNHQLSHIIGQDSIIPKGVIYEVFKSSAGLQSKPIEFHAMVSSVEDLLNVLSNNKNESHSHNNSNEQSEWCTQRIAETLKMEPEKTEHLEGYMFSKIFDRKRFFSFDKKRLEELPQMLVAQTELFREGASLRFNEMYSRKQVVVAFPLATGYPFIYTLNMPTLLQAIGNIQVKTSPSIVQNPTWRMLKSLQTANIIANVHVVLSTDQIAKTGFLTPFDRKRYVAGHVRKSYVHVPLNLKMDFDFQRRSMSSKFTPIDSHQNFNFMEASAWPFTLRKDVFDLRPAAEAKDLKLITTHQPRVQNRILGEESTGMVFKIHMENHLSSEEKIRMHQTLWYQGIEALKTFPVSYRNLMKRVLTNQEQSFWSFLPHTYQQSTQSGIERKFLLSMIALPYFNELTPEEFVRFQGILSFVNFPFSDVETLQETAKHSAILSAESFPWPSKTLDQYYYDIKYDASRSANQVVKFTVNFDKNYSNNKEFFEASNRMQGPSNVEEKRLAISSDLKPNSQERRQQFLENAAHGIRQSATTVFDMSIVFDGTKRTEYIATISHAHSHVDDKSRILIFMSAKPIKPSAAQQISVTLTAKYPKRPMLNFEQALNQNEKSNIRAHIYIGETVHTEPTYIKVQAEMEQTERYRNYLTNENSDGKQCIKEELSNNHRTSSCLNATYLANLRDHIRISTEIENSNQQLQKAVREILRSIHQMNYWNSEQHKQNETVKPNHIETSILFMPNMNIMNVSIATEDTVYNFKDIPSDNYIASYLTDGNHFSEYHHDYQAHRVEDSHICNIDEHEIITFDRSILHNEMENCWYAAVQTNVNLQSSEMVESREISVLVRNHRDSKTNEFMVIVEQKEGKDHVIQVSSDLNVRVNNQERKVSQHEAIEVYDAKSRLTQEPVISIYQRIKGENVIQVGRNLMNIVYNGKRLRIHMDSKYRGNTYGLCGTYTGEKFDDFVTPRKCVVRNEKLFTSSWALPDETCSNQVKELRSQAHQLPCSKVQYFTGKFITKSETDSHRINAPVSSEEFDMKSGQSSEQRDRHYQQQNRMKCNIREQVQFIENNDKICFTINPLPVCPTHCTAQRKEEVRVNVHCRNINESVAQLYKQHILRGANPDISSRPVSKTVTFNVPTSCVVVN